MKPDWVIQRNAVFPSVKTPILKVGKGTVGVSVAQARKIWPNKRFLIDVFGAILSPDSYAWACEGLGLFDHEQEKVLCWLSKCPHPFLRQRLIKEYARDVL